MPACSTATVPTVMLPRSRHRIVRHRGLALVAGLLAGGLASADPVGGASCPIDAARAATAKDAGPAPAALPSTAGCLVSVQALPANARLFDLRDRADYVEFHVPGAQQASLGDLVSMPRTDGGAIVAYDAGRFRSDALLTCQRLHSAGLAKARVLDGGIVAWAHAHDRSRALQLNRLADAELPALLADASTRTVVLAPALQPALGARAAGKGSATVVLADASTPPAAIQARLGTPATFYWVGSPDRLRALIAELVAMDRKRESGPAERSACSAL
jgi:rhodanese-related sulfurtransferase